VRDCRCSPELHNIEPFVGNSGVLQDKMLAFAGITRGDISLLNVVQRRPPQNKFAAAFYASMAISWTKTGKPKKHELQPTQELLDYRSALTQQLKALAPNVVVACGAEALQALCGVSEITKHRGSVLSSSDGNFKVVPVLHPAYIIRGNFASYWITANDWKNKVSPQSLYPEIRTKLYTETIRPTIHQVTHFIESIGSLEPYSLDIETRGGHLACLALAVRSEVICVPLQTTTGTYFPPSEEAIFWRALGKLMTRNSRLVGQNLAFDLEYLLDYGVQASGVFMDTMVAHNLIYPELPKGLDFLCSTYLNVPYYKDEGKTWTAKQPDLQLWQYNNKDAIYTLWISQAIEDELKERNLLSFYHDYVGGLLPVALEMQRVRLRLDDANQRTLQMVLTDAIKSAHETLVLHAGSDVNAGSPKQVADLLYSKRGLPPPSGRGKKADATDENTLRNLYVHTQDQVCNDVILERHLRKRKSSYGDITFDPDGHLPFGVNIAGTESGRWSMKKSIKDRGCNAQTIPKIMRWAYVPPPARIFIQPDLSQAEARVVAWLSRCTGLVEIFSDHKRNVHSEVARDVFGREVEKDSLEYTLAKSMVHASNYRMGAGRFASETGLKFDEAQKLLAKFHARFPEIQRWHAEVRQRLITKGMLTTCFGRRRIFYEALGALVVRGKLTDDLWREAISYVPQSTVADLTNRALQATWLELGDSALWHNQSHDSFLFSVEPVSLRSAIEVARRCLKQTIMVEGKDLTIPSDFAIGYNWGMLKPYEGEETLSYGDWKRWEIKEWDRKINKARCHDKADYLKQQLSGII